MMHNSQRHPLKNRLLNRVARTHLPAGFGRTILLTFDDGPTPDVTEQVLDRLRRHHARAIFFVVGNKAEKHPRLLAEILAQGHRVGNHSHSHDGSPFPDPAAYFRDVRNCGRAIESATGVRPRYFRAPEGRMHPASVLSPALLGMTHILWSLDTNDWRLQNSQDVKSSAEQVLALVAPGDVLLLHDFDVWSVELLDIILPELCRRDFDLFNGLEMLEGPTRGNTER